uniref:Polyribonucleotide nucleotidyltransferase, putative n=1 Tax=Arundo donax TaxID=35708 RepID=A0A0A9EW31_ARUDO
MEITTEPFAKRATLPVSKAMVRPPISNSSRKLSSTFRPGCGGGGGASAAASSSAAPERNAARPPGIARGAAGRRRRGPWRARWRR